MPRQKAFTLIELLVVIAIIGLLTTLVLVNTSGTRGKAQVAKGLEFSGQVYNALGSEAVGIWNFDNGTGTIAYDNSGYGNNGTLTNGPLFATDTPYYVVGSGTGKYSMHFDGVDDYVEISHNANQLLTGGGTIEAWVNASGYGESGTFGGKIVDKSTSTGGQDGYTLFVRDQAVSNQNVFGFTINNGPEVSSAADSLVFGSWRHVAVTWDTTGLATIYVNGAKSGTPVISAAASYITTTNTLRIGNRSLATDRTFDGLIDDVRIYGVALTASEIQKHYVEGLGKHQLARQ